MPSNKPWLDGPSAKERAVAKMWQGGPFFLIGLIGTIGTLLMGFISLWIVVLGLAGLFWFVTGAITYFTGVE